MEALLYSTSSLATKALTIRPFSTVDLEFLNFIFSSSETMSRRGFGLTQEIRADIPKIVDLSSLTPSSLVTMASTSPESSLQPYRQNRDSKTLKWLQEVSEHAEYINQHRHQRSPVYGADLRKLLTVDLLANTHTTASSARRYFDFPNSMHEIIKSIPTRASEMQDVIQRFVFVIPRARSKPVIHHCSHPDPSQLVREINYKSTLYRELSPKSLVYHEAERRMQLYFPDKRLIQFDCGKLQQLAALLRQLKKGGHRALIFTQMSRMLDILEIFLNIYGYTYFRLDGTTKVEQRQYLMERFNVDKRIFLFILSTRSGGIGINLTGADTVIFYDSDWNPAMDQQAQDRCHRIGQTREVHIYRLISEHTVEENILLKANQKRLLDEVVIKGGSFTTDFFKNIDVRELIDERLRGFAFLECFI